MCIHDCRKYFYEEYICQVSVSREIVHGLGPLLVFVYVYIVYLKPQNLGNLTMTIFRVNLQYQLPLYVPKQSGIISHILAQKSVITLEGREKSYGALWCHLTYYRSFQVLPVRKAIFLARKQLVYQSTAAIKQQQRLTNLTNPTLVCSYRSSCIDLPVELFDCQVEGRTLCLYRVFQGGYVILNGIDFEGGEQKIFCDCVDDLGREGRGGG